MRGRLAPMLLVLAAASLLALLVAPLLGLLAASAPADVLAGVRDPIFVSALALSAWTSALSVLGVVVGGTPLAWWIATARTTPARLVEVLLDLPIVLPPAVLGFALLETFGRRGLFGPLLEGLGITLPFTTSAVILAQIVVAAPFYVHSAVAAFRRVEPDLLLVARTLGQTRTGAVLQVAVPLALPGLVGGAVLAWARALGELGATLLFAGSRVGVTQTMPLAIFNALESDVRVALALSLALGALSALLLAAVRVPFGRRSEGDPLGEPGSGPEPARSLGGRG